MKPLSLSLRNVRTYEALDLDLPEGAVAIVGSNGAGKSTLVNAVDVALFGPESRTLADWLSEDQRDGTMNVTLTFEHEGEVYRARRSYSGKGRGTSAFDLEELQGEFGAIGFESGQGTQVWAPLTVESQKSTQQVLEELIGLNRKTFRASSFISQGSVFCDLDAREQKRILGELLDLGQWEQWLKQARDAKSAIETELAKSAGALERAEAEIATRATVEIEREQARLIVTETRTELDTIVARLATAREALAEARGRVERRASAEKAAQSAAQALADLVNGLVDREDSLRSLDARLETRPMLARTADKLANLEAEWESLRKEIAQWDERQRLEAEHARLMREAGALRLKEATLYDQSVKVLEGIGTESCDRCGQTLHADAAHRAAESYRAEANEHSFRANNIEEHDLVVLNEKISALPAERPDAERWNAIDHEIAAVQAARAQLAALDEAQKRRDELADEIQKMRAGLPDREADVETARRALDELGPHDPQAASDYARIVADLEQQERSRRNLLSSQESLVAVLQDRLGRIELAEVELDAIHKRRAGLNRDLDVVTRLERACGANGVPAMILENIAIPQIETAADEILSRFGSKALGVQLLTQREKKDGGLADTLQINVLTEHGSRDYKTFSTGERLRVNAAITLAIAQLVAARSAQTGLLVIDDLGPLDARGMAVLAEICNELQATVGRVYVISQAAELRDAFVSSLEVVSVDGRSVVSGAEALVGEEVVVA